MASRSAPRHLPKDVADVWRELRGNVDEAGPDFEAYCGQIARLRDAQGRISREGLVVADAKGSPVPHPALEVERKAQVEIRAWAGRFKRSSLSPSPPAAGGIADW